MITFRKFGKPVSISRSDWDTLKKRFDPSKVEENRHGRIEVKCPLCDRYIFERKRGKRSCEGCPFDQFEKPFDSSVGCSSFMEMLIPSHVLSMGLWSISWADYESLDAKQELTKIRRLMGFIERRQ